MALAYSGGWVLGGAPLDSQFFLNKVEKGEKTS